MRIAAKIVKAKRARAKAARGFSLLELAIAMFIFGLVISSILGPAADLYKRNKNTDATKYLATASRAVMDYALRNRTAYREITYDGVPAVIPAGRPYLPCPDIDGDGIENRIAITTPVVINAARNISGTCASQKGTIPWRTLQLTPIDDPWDNHLTYHVDFAYSNALLGFDETSRADHHDLTRTVDAMGIYASRLGSNAPFIICDKALTPGTGNAVSGCNPVSGQGSIIGGIIAVNTGTAPYQYTFPINNPNDLYLGGIVNGAVFVLVSHGANGNFARRRSGGGCRGAEITDANLFNYGGINPNTSGSHERRNAFFACGDHARAANPYRGLTGAMLQSYYFSYPIGRVPDAAGEYDDHLRWAMASELMGALSNAAKEREREAQPPPLLPIPKLTFLP